jgi:hypothetical protein
MANLMSVSQSLASVQHLTCIVIVELFFPTKPFCFAKPSTCDQLRPNDSMSHSIGFHDLILMLKTNIYIFFNSSIK